MGSSLVHYLCLMFLLLSITKVHSLTKVFNVRKYGAISDGKTDNSKAFLSAWNEACQSVGGGVVLIPKGTFRVNPVVFTGSCKGRMHFILQGVLKAPTYQQDQANSDHWISFQYVDNLYISGGGSLDGQGPSAWPHNKCAGNPHCKQLPISLRLDFVRKARVSYIKLIDSKNFQMNIFACYDIVLDHIHISAPDDSPNTDGIHIAKSTGIKVLDSFISTGDDCISFGDGTRDVEVRGVYCGPGHGISIGSLGKYPNEEDVGGFVIKNCSFSGTQNGIRIKTWAPSPPSNVYNITFENIRMSNVRNPIIIDQKYCPSGKCAQQGSSQVQIRDVKFRNIYGISSSRVPVALNCSQSRPCQKIELRDINLVYNGKDGRGISQCFYANGVAYGREQPASCL